MRPQIFIENFPAELRELVIADAEGRSSNMNSVMVEILSGVFGVPFDGGGRRASAGADGAKVVLRPPLALYRRLREVALENSTPENRRSAQDEIIAALSGHYGLVAAAA